MERFVQSVVAGGVSLVAGLWAVRLATPQSPGWLAGAAMAVLGTVALAAGIRRELTG